MVRRGYARGTIEKRCREVRAFVAHVEASGGRWPDVDRRHVERWLDSRAIAASARYAAVSHLHRFHVWAIREGYCDVDPTQLVERPRIGHRLPRPAREHVVDRLISDAPAPMALALSLMADAGLRCCEVARCRWADVDTVLGLVYVNGKGDRDRMVGMPRRLRRAFGALDGGGGFVLGRAMTPARVSQLVGAYMREHGADATAHQLRHLYATRLYRATAGDLLAVQQALGHASVMSTQIYAQIDPGRAIAAARALESAGDE